MQPVIDDKKKGVDVVVHMFGCWTLIGEQARVRVFVKPWRLLWGELVAMCLRGGADTQAWRCITNHSLPFLFLFYFLCKDFLS